MQKTTCHFLTLNTLLSCGLLFSMNEEYLKSSALSNPKNPESLRIKTANYYRENRTYQKNFFANMEAENITKNQEIIDIFFKNGLEFVLENNLFSTILESDKIKNFGDALLLIKICINSYFGDNENISEKGVNIARALDMSINSNQAENFLKTVQEKCDSSFLPCLEGQMISHKFGTIKEALIYHIFSTDNQKYWTNVNRFLVTPQLWKERAEQIKNLLKEELTQELNTDPKN